MAITTSVRLSDASIAVTGRGRAPSEPYVVAEQPELIGEVVPDAERRAAGQHHDAGLRRRKTRRGSGERAAVDRLERRRNVLELERQRAPDDVVVCRLADALDRGAQVAGELGLHGVLQLDEAVVSEMVREPDNARSARGRSPCQRRHRAERNGLRLGQDDFRELPLGRRELIA